MGLDVQARGVYYRKGLTLGSVLCAKTFYIKQMFHSLQHKQSEKGFVCHLIYVVSKV